MLRIKEHWGRLNERLLSMGPESGIVDGESPLISLSYIDKMGYKCTYTCAHMVSTESVCCQLGSCLVACYLLPTGRVENKIYLLAQLFFFLNPIKVHEGYLPYVTLYIHISNLSRPLWPVSPWCVSMTLPFPLASVAHTT